MMSPAPPRADRPAVRAPERISGEIRRFALLWVACACLVLVFVAGASMLASHYRDAAGRRARVVTEAQLSVARIKARVERQSAEVLSYRASGGAARYRTAFVADGYGLRSEIAGLRAATTAGRPSDLVRLHRLTHAIGSWEGAAALEVAAPHGGAGGVSRAADPAPVGEVPHIAAGLDALERSLTTESSSAIADARTDAHRADLLRAASMVIGLLLLAAGGARLLRRAFALAGEADARREREAAWSSQIEAVLAWSVRAKGAATRSQLIGFTHSIPREAVGAACFFVSEGAAVGHPSHGRPRFAIEVDDSGQGLHVSVCFEDGRGDEHDHHALDLLLGHPSALWRTVLRQEELERAAGHDALTGLPNRRAFEAELRRRVALSRRRDLGFTLAIVDLDHFKLVNDRLGHPEGDSVLRRAGEAVRGALRASDRVFRIGGEEFAMILETGDETGVADLLERAREAVKHLGVTPAEGRMLSASIGWAVFPHDADERADLIAQADAALYRAKSEGRDRVIRAGMLDSLAS